MSPSTFIRTRAVSRLVVPSLLATVAWAAAPTTGYAATTNLVPNASFEHYDAARHAPSCWLSGRTGSNTGSVTRTTRAHGGSHAEVLRVTALRSGSRLLATRHTTGCAVPVTARSLSVWEHSTSGLRAVVSYRTPIGWSPWRTVARLAASRSWRHPRVTLPTPPSAATAMSAGFAVTRIGTAVVDAVAAYGPATQPVTTQPTTQPVTTQAGALWAATVPATPGLVTSEYAYWNPQDPTAVRSPDWEMTSGSLFSTGSALWTGRPDTANPNATSSNGTDSAVFRLTTKRANFGDVAVDFTLHNNGLTSTSTTPPVAWDGVHIFLHYQSEYELYYASVNRRDGHVVIKKKCAGGPSNGGSYWELGPGEVSGHAIPFGADQHVGASIVDNVDGSVTLTLRLGGATVVTATDTGVGCAPITAPGKVGIRGDNDDFTVSGFTVTGA